MPTMRAKERLYLNAEKTRLVREGSPKAGYLLAAEGHVITEETAARFKIVDGRAPWSQQAASDEPKPGADPKSGKGGGNKQGKPDGDKSGASGAGVTITPESPRRN